jgi:hypothetical protein
MESRLLPFGLGAALLGSIGALPMGPLWNAGVARARVPAVAAAVAPASAPVVSPVARAPLSMVDSALSVLAGKVVRQSDPAALRMAFHAYYAYRAAHPEQVRKPYLYYVDYGLDSRTPRGYVFDMGRLTVVDGPFTVAHGKGSSRGHYGVPVRFSNAPRSDASSLGLYLTLQSYAFTGRSGGRPYSSTGMRMQGLSGSFNGAALARGVVVHGAPYVTPTGAGRSEGCPAMEVGRARRLIPMIANGGLVFLFSPVDAGWMRQDPWANAELTDQLARAMRPPATDAAAQATAGPTGH